MAEYYNIKKLMINKEKTAILINSKPRFKEDYKEILIETGEKFDDVNQSETIKILGYQMNKRGSIDSQVAKTIGECHSKLNLADKNRNYLSTTAQALLLLL